MLPLCTSVSYDERRLIGTGFSKTLMAVWSEKRVSSMGFENGTPLNFRCACHGRSPAQNRSISRNERPDTLDPCIKSIRSSNIKIQLPSFPFGCYTNPHILGAAARHDRVGRDGLNRGDALARGDHPICIKVGYLPHHHDFRPRERPPYRTHSPQVIGDSSGVFFFVCTIPSVELA